MRRRTHYYKTDILPAGVTPTECYGSANFDGTWSINASNLTLGNFAFMFWIKLNYDADREANGWKNSIFAADTWHINFHANKLRIFNQETGGDVLISNTTFEFDKWYFVGLVYEGGDVNLFVGDSGADIENPVATTLEDRSLSGVDLGSYTNAKNIGKYGGQNLIADVDDFFYFWDTPAGLYTYIKAEFHGKYDLSDALAISDGAILYTFDEQDGFSNGGSLINTAPNSGSAPTLTVEGSMKLNEEGAPVYCGVTLPVPPDECCNAMVFNGSTEHVDPSLEIELGTSGALQGAFVFERSTNKEKDTLFAGSNWKLHRKTDGKIALNYADNELFETPSTISENIIKWLTLNWDSNTIKLFDDTTELVSHSYVGTTDHCKSLVFTQNDFMELPSEVSLGATFFISFWLEFTIFSTTPQTIFQNEDGTMRFYQFQDRLTFSYNNVAVWDYTYFPGYNTPKRYGLRLNNDTFDLFIDDQLVFTHDSAVTIDSAGLRQIGAWPSSTFWGLKGNLDNFEIWDVLRTDQQIIDGFTTLPIGNESGLVHYYQIKLSDDGQGELEDAVNASGNATFKKVDSGGNIVANTVTLATGLNCDEAYILPQDFLLKVAHIGRDSSSTNHFQGDLDEVRIWSESRTANLLTQQALVDPLSEANLEAYYSFENNTSGSGYVYDASGNNNHSNIGSNNLTLVTGFTCEGDCDDNGNGGSEGNIVVSGELRRWHWIDLRIEGDNTSEDAATNPYTDYRLDVIFTHQGTNKTVSVPGHYAADYDAANTSANSGFYWRVYFQPDLIGRWDYEVLFRKGENIAASLATSEGSPMSVNGTTGFFTILETNKGGKDFRWHGRKKRQSGKNFHRFMGTGYWQLRSHIGSPENFNAYHEFDGTYDAGGGLAKPGLVDGLHQYTPHVDDWQNGDPTWKNGKGKGIIGAVNFLSGLNTNGAYVILHTSDGGDGRDVWPWTGPSTHDRYDVSKLDQWEIVFRHAAKKGFEFQLFFHEVENQSAISSGLNNNEKIYIREMISRFAHLGISWNLGEECSLSSSVKDERFAWFRQIDPYESPLTFHTQVYADTGAGQYNPHWSNTDMDSVSFQDHISNIQNEILNARQKSIDTDNYLSIYFDEQTTPVSPNGGNADAMVDAYLKVIMHGGAGMSFWYGYQGTHGDVQTDEFNSTASLLGLVGQLRAFFEGNIAFYNMSNANNLVNNGNYCLSYPSHQYLVYGNPVNATLNLSSESGSFPVKWLDPQDPYGLQNGSVTSVNGGGTVSLGNPPNSQTGKKWLILVGTPIPQVEDGINGEGGGDGGGGGGGGGTDCQADYKEISGIVTIEAESFDISNTDWDLENSIDGYTGTGYLKYNGQDYPNTAGNQVISKTIEFTSAGTKRIQIRHRIAEGTSNTDHNDVWLKVEGADEFYASNGSNTYYAKGDPNHPNGPFPQGSGGNGYFKIFFNFLNQWSVLTQTSDNQIDHWIYLDINSPRVITLKISGRSSGYAFDRIMIWDTSQTNEVVATNVNNAETTCDDGGGGGGGGGTTSNGKYVVHIDIPGLRGDIVDTMTQNGSTGGIFDAATNGAYTFNARIDADVTNMLSGAISQITARPVLGQYGHQYLFDTYQAGSSVSYDSIYSVLDIEGFSSALYSINTHVKTLIDASYLNIDRSYLATDEDDIVNQFSIDMPENLYGYSFIQLYNLFTTGQNNGWNNDPNSTYGQEVLATSNRIQQIIDLIEGNAELKDKTYLIITSSHGGDGFSSINQTHLNTYRVPFIVWGGAIENNELYEININNRVDPGTQRITFSTDDSVQPIYHADAANLALELLGISSIIPNSAINNDVSLNVGIGSTGGGGGGGGGGTGTNGAPDFFQLHGTNFVLDAIDKGPNFLYQQPGRLYFHSQDGTQSGVTNQLFLDPILGFGGAYSMKPYIKQLKEGGMKRLIICLKNNPQFAQGLYGNDGPSAQGGGSTTNPESYSLHAQYILLWVRYIASIPASDKPEQIWVQYGNEFEEWWKGGGRQYTYNAPDGSANYSYTTEAGNWQAEEYSAMFIKAWQVCKAEAEAAGIRLMPPGHVAWDMDNFNRMVQHCNIYNNGEPPYHDICIHYYRNSKHYVTNSYRDGVDWYNAKGAVPEAHVAEVNGVSGYQIPSMRAQMQEIVDYINDTPNREGASTKWTQIGRHWTEHGYDINQGSPQEAYTPGISGQEAQGRFITRSYIMMAAVDGVDGCWQYFMKHGHVDGINDGNVFQSSGLFNDSTPYAPMISWYYHKQARELLQGMTCTAYDESDPHVFRFDGNGKTIYAVWKHSNNNSTISNHSLTTGGSGQAILHTLTPNQDNTSTSQLAISGGSVTIPTVSERPVFVEVEGVNSDATNAIGTGAQGETMEIG